MITREGAKPFPPTGCRTRDARTWLFYGATGITPAMAMRLTGIGSQYLLASVDADKSYFDRAETYKAILPKGIPEENFSSFTDDDNQTRSMLDMPRRYPRGQPELSVPRRRTECRWLDDGVLQPHTARGRQGRQLDPGPCPVRGGS
jgi:hypothetical protein